MQEIEHTIFIETKYSGVVIGAIFGEQNCILIDAPFRIEDVKDWKAQLAKVKRGPCDRLLVNLDTHLDRTLGVKGMECPVVLQVNGLSMVKNRSTALRSQEVEAGAIWEGYDGLGNMRWVSPEITFENDMHVQLGEKTVILEHHAGANPAGVWVKIPDEKVLFVGDSVVVDQPPFLAFADLEVWINDIHLLLTPEYRNYKVIGGRNGLLSHDDIKAMGKQLRSMQGALERLEIKGIEADSAAVVANKWIKKYDASPENQDIYLNRLKWGINAYFDLHEFPQKLNN